MWMDTSIKLTDIWCCCEKAWWQALIVSWCKTLRLPTFSIKYRLLRSTTFLLHNSATTLRRIRSLSFISHDVDQPWIDSNASQCWKINNKIEYISHRTAMNTSQEGINIVASLQVKREEIYQQFYNSGAMIDRT